jgi:hypothetical protein
MAPADWNEQATRLTASLTHDVSNWIVPGHDDEWCRGVSPRLNLSMMCMRPPQQGHLGLSVSLTSVFSPSAAESRLRKSEQDDKWSFCLTAGTLCPANQEKQ